jgi:hypothetical protein
MMMRRTTGAGTSRTLLVSLSTIEIARAMLEGRRSALLRTPEITRPTLLPRFPRILAGTPRPRLMPTGLEALSAIQAPKRGMVMMFSRTLLAGTSTILREALSTKPMAMMSPPLLAVLSEALSAILTESMVVMPSLPAVLAEAFPALLTKTVVVMTMSKAVTAMVREALFAKLPEPVMVMPSLPVVLAKALSALLAKSVVMMTMSKAMVMREPLSAKFATPTVVSPALLTTLRETLSTFMVMPALLTTLCKALSAFMVMPALLTALRETLSASLIKFVMMVMLHPCLRTTGTSLLRPRVGRSRRISPARSTLRRILGPTSLPPARLRAAVALRTGIGARLTATLRSTMVLPGLRATGLAIGARRMAEAESEEFFAGDFAIPFAIQFL